MLDDLHSQGFDQAELSAVFDGISAALSQSECQPIRVYFDGSKLRVEPGSAAASGTPCCQQAHREVVRGKCPWCHNFLVNGEVLPEFAIRANFTSLRRWRQTLDPLLEQGAMTLEDIDDVLAQLAELIRNHRSKLVRISYDGSMDRWGAQLVES